MQIALTPELERRVAEAVASGQFSSPEEAVAEALHLLLASPDQRFAWIDDEIRQGIEAADRGELLAGDEIQAEIDAARFNMSGKGNRHVDPNGAYKNPR